MMRHNSPLAPLLEQGLLSSLDQGLGDWINSQARQPDLVVGTLAALVSHQLSQQQVCVSQQQLEQLWQNAQRHLPQLGPCPQPETLLSAEPCLTATPTEDRQDKPLVFDNNQWYLQRYWQHEVALASRLAALAKKRYTLDRAHLSALVASLFDPPVGDAPDWQKIAVIVAAMHQLAIITGGPGTGKTTTVSRLLALIQALSSHQGKPLRIVMAAPTGKAAARLSESLLLARSRLPADMAPNLPEQAVTLHRLLGPIPGKVGFRHHADNPIVADVLVLDEASMVDLPLMRRLLEALPEHCRVIMLGDHHQLASVEVGSVLGDIGASWYDTGTDEQAQFDSAVCDTIEAVTGQALPSAAQPVSLLQNNLVRLRYSHRFDANSGIGQLADAINRGDKARAKNLLLAGYEDVAGYFRPQYRQLLTIIEQYYPAYLEACQRLDLDEAFRALSEFQVLCATRQGYWGRDHLNGIIEHHLAKEGWIRPQQDFYHGRPIMVTQNNYRLQRFNGDIGIVMPDEDGLLKVWFQRADGGYDGLLPSRVPSHDTLYAMTIHKSQGSEFGHAVVCLPDTYSQVLSRELLYTGITRARGKVSLLTPEAVLNTAIAQPCQRGSGLADRLSLLD